MLTLGGFVFLSKMAKAEDKPDLTIKNVSFYPRDPYKGEKFTGQIHIQVQNIGQAEAVEEDTIGIKIPFKITTLSQDDSSLVELYSMDNYINNISTGSQVEVTLDIIDLDFNVEHIHLVAWVDSDAIRFGNGSLLENNNLSINESNEDNNTFFKHIILTKDTSVVCIDSDGGMDYYTQGRIEGIDTWGNKNSGSSFIDSCISQNKLEEVFCGDDGYVYKESFECFYGCINGACNKEQKNISIDTILSKRLSGRLLLDVDSGGSIWYVDNVDYKRHNVRWNTALGIFQKFALGITDGDLLKIPVDINSVYPELDTDGDGYKDRKELMNGYNPYNSQPVKFMLDNNFGKRLKGKFLLQVQKSGAIWYVAENGYRYSVRMNNLDELFKSLALGITNNDLNKIEVGE